MSLCWKHRFMNSEKFPLVIFAHIEKTGGTSLNGILRTYHGVRYVPVRALTHPTSTSHRAVHLNDLSLYSKLAPWVH